MSELTNAQNGSTGVMYAAVLAARFALAASVPAGRKKGR
jgi:hypothetical protein